MWWPFRRRGKRSARPRGPVWTAGARQARHWRRLTPIRLVTGRGPVIALTGIGLPDVAGARRLLPLRHRRSRLDAPRGPAGRVPATVRELPVVAEPPARAGKPVEAVTPPQPEAPVVPRHRARPLPARVPTASLVQAGPDYVGEPVVAATPFRSITELDRLAARYEEMGLENALSMLGMGLTGPVAPPPVPVEPVEPGAERPTAMRRPTLGQSRRLGVGADLFDPDDAGAPTASAPRDAGENQEPQGNLGDQGGSAVAAPASTVTAGPPVPPQERRDPDLPPPWPKPRSPRPAPHRAADADDTGGSDRDDGDELGDGADRDPGGPASPPVRPVQVRREPPGAAASQDVTHRRGPERAQLPTTVSSLWPRTGPLRPPPTRPRAEPPPAPMRHREPPDDAATSPADRHEDTGPVDRHDDPPRPWHAPATAEAEPPVPPVAEEPVGPVGPVYRADLDDRAPVAATPPSDPVVVGVPAELVTLFRQELNIDVSTVPVHRGRTAAGRAARLGARAFAQGGEVFLPDAAGGLDDRPVRALLAHELTHAVQQRDLGSAQPVADSVEGRELEGAAREVEEWVRGERGTPPPLRHRTTVAGAPATPGAPGTTAQLAPAAVVEPTTGGQTAGQAAPEPTSWSLDTGFGTTPSAAPETPPPAEKPAPAGPAADQAALAAAFQQLADLQASVGELRERHAAGERGRGEGIDLGDLAAQLYQHIRSRLRAELVIDRERAGVLVDFG